MSLILPGHDSPALSSITAIVNAYCKDGDRFLIRNFFRNSIAVRETERYREAKMLKAELRDKWFKRVGAKSRGKGLFNAFNFTQYLQLNYIVKNGRFSAKRIPLSIYLDSANFRIIQRNSVLDEVNDTLPVWRMQWLWVIPLPHTIGAFWCIIWKTVLGCAAQPTLRGF